MMTLLGWVLLVTVLLVVTAVAVLCVARARRLDRLHVRTDAARAGLEAALDRRCRVAGEAAAALRVVGHDTVALTAVAGAAQHAPLDSREVPENALSRQLAVLDRRALADGLLGRLVDAEQLVVLARRVHNDAVRDTLDLRSRRLVRWLRLYGTATLPGYFDIADPEPPDPEPGAPATRRSAV